MSNQKSAVNMTPSERDVRDNPPDTTSGLTVTTASSQKVRKIIRKKRRPARPQVDPATFKSEPPPQTGVTFKYVAERNVFPCMLTLFWVLCPRQDS